MKGIKKKNQIDIQAYTMIFALGIIWFLFTLLTNGTFITARNISNLFIQMAVTGILTTGMVLVIISGNIDLSVGSLMGMLGGFAAILQVNHNFSTPAAIAVTLLVGLAVGCMQGFIIAYLHVPAFIVTLGGLMAYRGVLLGIAQGRTISPMNPSFNIMGQSYIEPPLSIIFAFIIAVILILISLRGVKKQGSQLSRFQKLVKIFTAPVLIIGFTIILNMYKGIPMAVIIMLSTIAVFTFLAKQTVFGRSVYAIGGNAEAALYSGIKINKIILGIFILQGMLSAAAGMVLAARLNAGTISAGQSLELDVIAAAVIGGTSLAGGKGSVPGAFLGALVMASLNNGMSIMNVDSFWQMILKGIILVVAVYIDVMNTERKLK